MPNSHLPQREDDQPPWDQDSIQGSLDELFVSAKRYRQSDEYMELLEFIARFPEYSAYNMMLVHVQMRGAKFVLPATRWWREYRRIPKPSAQPLVMLQPMGPVMFGFDVSQTECTESSKEHEAPDRFENPFRVDGCLDPRRVEKTQENARRDGVEITSKPLGRSLGGYVRDARSPSHVIGMGLVQHSRDMRFRDEEIPIQYEITLNASLADKSRYSTLTHELGHLYCGHLGSPNPSWWPDRRELDRNAREFEAESVSFLVCQRAGLQTSSAQYMNGYLRENAQVPAISLEAVMKAAMLIERMGTKTLPKRRNPKNQ